MVIKSGWPKPGESSSFSREMNLNYIALLVECLKEYRDGKINADTTLRVCRQILSEIKDPEFPFFAVQNFKELFSFILYQLPEAAYRCREALRRSKRQEQDDGKRIPLYDGLEKRKNPRIEKPFMVRFRINQYEGHKMISSNWDMLAIKDLSAMGVCFHYNKHLGIGSIIDLKLDISHSMQTINCVGKVIRIRKTHGYPGFSIVTEFTVIDKEEKVMIDKTVKGVVQ
ncbi:MAG: PilZ domain-containing protein [Candidatus Scalindua sp.]|nr:PilZ domain-containing protein [Candidatus Scalindua sp.]